MAVVLGMVVVMSIRLEGNVEASPPAFLVYMKVHTRFRVFVVVYNLLPQPPVVLWPVVWTLWFT